jgi:hypothetical protein
MAEPPQDSAPDSKMPRGVLIVVGVGLLACLAAALLSTGKGSGEVAYLEWVQKTPIPASDPVAVPGGKGEMELKEGDIRATGTNVSGYSLFRVATTLRIEKGSPVGGGRILCSVKAGKGTEIAQTSGGLRATYPRSSEDGIYGQEAPEVVLIDFSSHGAELAVLEVEDLPNRFTTEKGVKLEWPEYEVGTENLKYFLPDGKPKGELELPFDTVWKTTGVPAASIACTLTTSAGEATAKTSGALEKASPPIDEEAEEEKQAEREEAEEEKEEEEG